ncbi:hypothetical protein KKH24_00145 [Patescibacteria group bacterium]|nr:hypothetical protein [Patescibacteria group bacterium]
MIGRTLVMDMHGGKPRYFIDGDARLNPDLLGGAPRADVEIFDVLFSVVVNLARPRLQSRVVCSEKFLWFPRVRCVRLREGEVTLRLTDSIGNSLQFPDKTVLMALAPGISCLDIWVAHMMHDKKDLETQLDNVKRERSAYGATIRIAMEALDASHRFMRSKHAQAIRQWLRERYASLLTHDLEIIDEMPSWPRGLPKPECTPLQDKDQPRN